MAVGILAVGLMFIAGTFPVGIGLTATATERTVAAVVADEAFAKIKLYGVREFTEPNWVGDPTQECVPYDQVESVDVDPAEFAYPSIDTTLPRQYCWSALCRLIDGDQRLVQVTVFVNRKTGAAATYPDPTTDDPYARSPWPKPVRLPPEGKHTIPIMHLDEWTFVVVLSDFPDTLFFTANAAILDDQTGELYHIQNLEREDIARIITLDRQWGQPKSIWVIPPPVGGGRYPCIGIYQRIIKF